MCIILLHKYIIMTTEITTEMTTEMTTSNKNANIYTLDTGTFEGHCDVIVVDGINKYIRSGYGVMLYNKDYIKYDNLYIYMYKGNWVNDKKSGNGMLIYSNKEIYTGEWVNDKKSGKGMRTYSNKEIYTGEWVNNKRFGKGKIICLEDECKTEWVGEWNNDKKMEMPFIKIIIQAKFMNNTGYTIN